MTGFLVVLFTLIAFAANSLLCRVALGRHLIDPVSFTTVRLASGAVALWFLLRASTGSFAAPATKASRGTWGSGLALFVYAGAFSLAYLSLSTGTGASGRTARAGKKGVSIAFIDPKERTKIKKLENELDVSFTEAR
jgi:hypothetical protein